MGFVGAVAAAQRARMVREFVNHLREQKSFARETAATLRPQTWMGKRTLRALVSDGSIVSAGEDLYWLDEAAYAVARKRRQGRVVWVILALAILVVGAIALAGVLGPGSQG